jgi:hypothetical protein
VHAADPAVDTVGVDEIGLPVEQLLAKAREQNELPPGRRFFRRLAFDGRNDRGP